MNTTISTEPGLEALTIAGRSFNSRLCVGTGKYASMELMRDALDVSGAEAITVAVRRERLFNAEGKSLLEYIDLDRYTILPNTAGCFNAEDAVRVARLGRELLEQLGNPGASWVKLEVLGDKKTLLPDPVGTLQAVEELVVLCLELLKENDPSYPVIVDAGVGSASDVAYAMELGADGVLLNTAIAHAKQPVMMAHAMRKAIEAGRQSYLAGRIDKKLYATASSPMEGAISYIPGE